MDYKKVVAESVKKISSLPESASRLITIMASGSYKKSDIESIVKMDPILTGRLLTIVNSAAFSLSRQITSVAEAIPLLGERLIVTLALEMGAATHLKKVLAGYRSGLNELWEHSIKSAIASRELATIIDSPVPPGTAYTCGLMHDIGKSILSLFLEDHEEELLSILKDRDECDFLAIEKEILGINHVEAGYLLVTHWELPEIFRVATLFHHTPAHSPKEYRMLCNIIHMADITAMLSGCGTGADTLRYQTSDEIANEMPIKEKEMELLFLKTEDEFQSIKNTISF